MGVECMQEQCYTTAGGEARDIHPARLVTHTRAARATVVPTLDYCTVNSTALQRWPQSVAMAVARDRTAVHVG